MTRCWSVEHLRTLADDAVCDAFWGFMNSDTTVQSDTGAPPDSSRVEEVDYGGAGSCSGGPPQPGMDCLHNFLQKIITSLQILKEST